MTAERLTELIQMAGQSRAGFFTLIVIFLSGFMIVALDRSPPFIRFSAYAGLAIGIGMFSLLVYEASQLPPGSTGVN